MAIHKDLPSNEWHPAYPPGISTSTDGQVFIANGLGGGSWTSLDDLVNAGKQYGSIICNSNVSIPLTVAIDPDLNLNSDYIPLNTSGMWAAGDVKDVTVDTTNGSLTTQSAGAFTLAFWANHSVTASSNIDVAIKYLINGAEYSSVKLETTSDFSGEYKNISAMSVVPFNSGDTVQIVVVAAATCDFKLNSAELVVMKV